MVLLYIFLLMMGVYVAINERVPDTVKLGFFAIVGIFIFGTIFSIVF